MAELKIGQYVLGVTLGKGSFGKVKLGKHQLTGHEVAVKIVNRKKMRSVDASGKVRREIQYLKLFHHPHIIKLYQVIPTPADIFMVMEYVSGGELFDYIIKHGKLEEKEARRFFQQIMSGVDYCHRHFIVHRDLKPENLLVDKDGNVKIADFGLSNMMTDGEFLNTSCGSPNYAAPEVISAKLYAGPEVDIWSCGVILYALLNGALPFDDENMGLLFKKIRNGLFSIPADMPAQAADLVNRMLVVDPLNRASMQEIKCHDWFLVDLPGYLFPLVDSHAEPTALQEDVVEEIASAVGAFLASRYGNRSENAVIHIAKRFKVDRQAVVNAVQCGGDEDKQLYIAYQLVVDNRQLHMTRGTPPTAVCPDGGPLPGTWGLYATSPLRSLPSPVAANLGHTSRFFQASHYAHMDTGRKPRWHLGIRCSSQCSPSSIMKEVYQSLLRLGFEWKTVGAYTIICRKQNAVRSTYSKMTLQLYKVDNAYLVDFKSLPSAPISDTVASAAVDCERPSSSPSGRPKSDSLLSTSSTASLPFAGRSTPRGNQADEHNSMEFFEMCALLVTALVVR